MRKLPSVASCSSLVFVPRGRVWRAAVMRQNEAVGLRNQCYRGPSRQSDDIAEVLDMSQYPNSEPFELFHRWFAEAQAKEPNDPNAMALATVSADGQPSVRMVLLKDADPRGFVFYTNYESRKGRQLLETHKAAIVLHWKSLGRQVRAEGAVESVTDAEADAYFASRPKASQ